MVKATVLLGWAVVLGALTASIPVALFPLIVPCRFTEDEERQLSDAFVQGADDCLCRSRD